MVRLNLKLVPRTMGHAGESLLPNVTLAPASASGEGSESPVLNVILSRRRPLKDASEDHGLTREYPRVSE